MDLTSTAYSHASLYYQYGSYIVHSKSHNHAVMAEQAFLYVASQYVLPYNDKLLYVLHHSD